MWGLYYNFLLLLFKERENHVSGTSNFNFKENIYIVKNITSEIFCMVENLLHFVMNPHRKKKYSVYANEI